MILRIWKVGLLPEKSAKLEDFANNISLPMFRTQRGCLGVLFTRTETECATITLWESEQAIQEMENSPLYRDVVRQIEQSEILGTDHQTQVFSVYGGFIDDKTPSVITQR